MLFFVPPIALGILAALAAGGRLSRLADLRFRYGWLIISAFSVQILIFTPFAREFPANDVVVPALHILSNLVLVAAISLNWGIPGLRAVALGLLLNFAAITTNGGYMPVSGEVLERVGRTQYIRALRESGPLSKSVLMTDQTRVPFLADILVIDTPVSRDRVFSVGDVLISLGAFLLVFNGMRPKLST